MKICIYGASESGKKCKEIIKWKFPDSEVVAFIDRDKKGYIENVPIYTVDYLENLQFDKIIIASTSNKDEIAKTLMDRGIENIDTSLVDTFTNARNIFVESIASIFKLKCIEGNVAEVGVYKGEFAAFLNNVFKGQLYLYDTFSGFDERDLVLKNGEIEKKTDRFSDTSVSLVIKKMSHPDRVIIRKGYFPNTVTKDDEDAMFCFVNLDCDLYQPIKAGLEFFFPRLVKNGVILVHDFFSDEFTGVRDAVEEFCGSRNLSYLPIGDGYSVAIINF